jgi:hypothetical protein
VLKRAGLWTMLERMHLYLHRVTVGLTADPRWYLGRWVASAPPSN